jgi:hypothetical protein
VEGNFAIMSSWAVSSCALTSSGTAESSYETRKTPEPRRGEGPCICGPMARGSGQGSEETSQQQQQLCV